MASPLRPSTPEPSPSERIPFRIRVGVTGKRRLAADDEAVRAAVRRQLGRVRQLVGPAGVQLAVVSQLAEGADRIVVEEVLAEARERGEDARLEVVLPLERAVYAADQRFTAASRMEFERLLERAHYISEPPPGGVATACAYEAASAQVVARCDVLLALWDGEPPLRRGGTGATLARAAAIPKPCIWISVSGDREVRDNLEIGSAARFYDEIRALSGASMPAGSAQPVSVLDSLAASFAALGAFSDAVEAVARPAAAEPAWIAGPLGVADLLAERCQTHFRRVARAVFACATLAALMLAIGVAFGGRRMPALVEASLLALALAGVWHLRRRAPRHRWLAYRVLAERLRSARFLAAAGVDFRARARLDTVFAGGGSEDWVTRAFEEVWDRRPQGQVPAASLDELKRELAAHWIGDQIAYHERAAKRHRDWDRLATPVAIGAFGLAAAAALAHALGAREQLTEFLSIVFPAAGASLGGLLTVEQHRGLHERSLRMVDELRAAQREIAAADEDGLARAASDAARLMAQETGDWLGALWFLDVEHP